MGAPGVEDPGFWSGSGPQVFAPPRLEEEGNVLRQLLGTEDGIVFASSGSGGQPKWVRLSREALLASAGAVNSHLGTGGTDVWMRALPLFHVGGFGVAARAYAAGCGYRRFAGRWNAMRFTEELDEHGVTLTSLVPTQVHDLVDCELRPPSVLRAVVVGGARLDEVTGQAARDLGWPVLQSYGMTETASQVATAALDSLEDEFRASPLPLLGPWEARVGDEGCVELRGPGLLEEYLRLDNNKIVRAAPLSVEGWFVTTDLGEVSDRALTVTGRADRHVKILGELVDLAALEDELEAHLARGVAVRVVAWPDERRGFRLVPVIEEGEAGAEDVVGLVNERLPGFARLEKPRLVKKLPRTPLGKVDEAVLREEIGARDSSGLQSGPSFE